MQKCKRYDELHKKVLKDQTVEGTVSGGMVTAVANGDGKF